MRTQVVPEKSIQAIQNLEFANIRGRLQAEKHWSKKKVDAAEMWYKRFLMLALKYPDMVLVPAEEVDEFFHAHVLDTQRYRKETKQIFGRFLDHTPTYGLVDLQASFDATNELYRKEFGEDCLLVFKRRPDQPFRSCCMGKKTKLIDLGVN